MLTPRQEADLGATIDEAEQWSDDSFSAPVLDSYPKEILHRLLAKVPGGATLLANSRIRFYDGTFPNAFTGPGGQIFVSRQIATFLHGEDDLAALLAHELGHDISHQGAMTFSDAARDLLHVDHFTDANSVLDAYSRMIDFPASNPKEAKEWATKEVKRSRDQQESADRIALSLLADAGYSPESLESLLDQLAQTQGQTGNWFTNLFRVTSADEQRLSALHKAIEAMPTACRDRRPTAPVGDFDAWRTALIGFERPAGPTSLHGAIVQGKLEPGLPSSIDMIRFSPDGRYLLALDASGVLLFTTHPLRFQFRLNAPDVEVVGFSSDSQSLILHTTGLREEQWRIATPKRLSMEMTVPLERCWAESDSADGRYVAVMSCGGDLSVMEVSTGRTIFTKKGQGSWDAGAFSPDDKYFLATQEVQDGGLFPVAKPVLVDLSKKKEVSLPDTLKHLLGVASSFDFLGSGRLAIETHSTTAAAVRIVNFPDGKEMSGIEFHLSPASQKTLAKGQQKGAPPAGFVPTSIAGATGGGGILVSPFEGYASALLDVPGKRVVARFPSSIVDAFGDLLAIRHRNSLWLANLKSEQIISSVNLPPGRLGSLAAAAVSPDMRWLAISGPQEGAIFSLPEGREIDQTSAFTGAWFGADDALYASMVNPPSGAQAAGTSGTTIERIDLGKSAPPLHLNLRTDQQQFGHLILSVSSKLASAVDAFPKTVVIEARSLTENKVLWTRTLPWPKPDISLEPDGKTLLFGWALTPKLHGQFVGEYNRRFAKLRDFLGVPRDVGYEFHILDAETGRVRASLFLPGLSWVAGLASVRFAGSELVVSDSQGRTQVFSAGDSKREGLALGRLEAASPDGKLACLALTPRELQIAALPTLKASEKLEFPWPVSFVRFGPDGRRLIVVTSDQEFFLLDVSKLSAQRTQAQGG